LLHSGITNGCSPYMYCPDAYHNRQQMAKLICNAMNTVNEGACATHACLGIFYDVPASNIFCPYIEGLLFSGIISGCLEYPFSYCPESLVQRQALAKVVCSGMELTNQGSCILAPCEGIFNDVVSSNPFCSHIEALYNAGVISGCISSAFCPQNTVTRGQIAKFLSNAFGLQL
jgi:hypothetical protein